MAAWLLRLLKISEYLPENVKTSDSADNKLSCEELFIAGLLLHNLQLLQFNSHEVRIHNATLHFAQSYLIALRILLYMYIFYILSLIYYLQFITKRFINFLNLTKCIFITNLSNYCFFHKLSVLLNWSNRDFYHGSYNKIARTNTMTRVIDLAIIDAVF